MMNKVLLTICLAAATVAGISQENKPLIKENFQSLFEAGKDATIYSVGTQGNIYDALTDTFQIRKYVGGKLVGQLNLDPSLSPRDIAVSEKDEVFLSTVSLSKEKSIEQFVLLSYNSDLTLKWKIGSLGEGRCNSIKWKSGRLLITGSLADKTKFSGHKKICDGLFYSEISSSGVVTKFIQSKKNGEGWEVDIDGAGNVFILGGFKDTLDLGKHQLNFAEPEFGNHFLAKFNQKGECENLITLGHNYYEPHKNLTVNSDGTVFLSHWKRYGGFTLSSHAHDFNLLWKKDFNAIYGKCGGIGIDKNGNLVIAGSQSEGDEQEVTYFWRYKTSGELIESLGGDKNALAAEGVFFNKDRSKTYLLVNSLKEKGDQELMVVEK